MITVPRLITLILQHNKLFCHSKNFPLRAYPIELTIGDGRKLQELIFNPVRDLPLIYISVRKTSEKWTDIGELLISPTKVTNCVMGNAFVYYSKSLEFSEEADYLLGHSYQCHNGDIRVYFPRIDKNNPEDHRRHRLIFCSTIEEWDEEELLSIFRKALAQNSDFFKRVLDYDYCSFMKNREEHEKQMLEVIKSRDEQIANIKHSSEEEKENLLDMALEDYDKLSKEHNSLLDDYEKLEKERDLLQHDAFNLNSHITMLNQKNAGGLVDENSQKLLRLLKQLPKTCVDVARVIEAAFPNTIVFTPKAYKSLEECRTAPELLWSLLYGMATVFFEHLHTNPRDAGQIFAQKAGVQYARGAGSQTRKDSTLMRGYEETFDGMIFNIESHFKKGNDDKDSQSLRVYFAWAPEQCQRIVVGHCGGHIDNYTTKKLH